jgi:protein O-mannosyl-transferase
MNSQDGSSDVTGIPSQAPGDAPTLEEPLPKEAPSGPRNEIPWGRVAAGILIFAVLMYPIMRRLWKSVTPTANRPATSEAATPPDLLTTSFRLYQAKRYREAIAAANAFLTLNPNSADAYNNLGVSYAGLEQWDDAIRCLQQAVRLRPDYQLAKNNLAWVEQSKLKQISMQSTPEYLLNQSLKEIQAGRFEEGLTAANAALKLRPAFAEAYNNIAVADIGLHRYDEAIVAAQTALHLKPDFSLAKNNLEWALKEKQKNTAEHGKTQ